MTDDERGRAYFKAQYPRSARTWDELPPQLRARYRSQARRINFTPPLEPAPEPDRFGQPHYGHDEREKK